MAGVECQAIGACEAAGEEIADLDTSFGNGDGLLLHGLMDSHLILLIHLVKLINAADAIVCQHQGPSLNAEFPTVTVLQQTLSLR